ncbi:hypothetical protein DRO53_01760 [Candidatus Bathyarchaeota archaeon]|nr:MAG: hypothetical protein DRO46_02765 [Candidatus Hecatellales archaeon]RLI35207.1 MAG: hypothetical protein DRO53_01760 [Candidatus Bathyarchaeota archaeon]
MFRVFKVFGSLMEKIKTSEGWLTAFLRSHQLAFTFPAILLVNLATAIYATQLFSASYPLGMDTFSHLPKLLYLVENGFASWFFDWYAGMPLFLFYPPLAYLIAYLPTLAGVDPILSYKIVEALFILATPFLLYLLSRKFGLGREKAAYAALIFSIIPFTPLNSIVFGRFPNIVALPFFLACLYFVVEAVEKFSRKSILLAGVFYALTLLTHHLSAYLLALVIVILWLNLALQGRSLRKLVKHLFSLGSPLLVGLLLSSFWIIPFLLYLKYWHQLAFHPSSVYYAPLAALIFLATVLAASKFAEKALKPKNFYSRFIFVWAALFLVYGSYLVPVEYLLPGGGELDLMRFQLYGSLPLAILLCSLENFSLGARRKILSKFRSLRFITVLLLFLNLLTGYVIFAFTPEVVAQEVDVGEIPRPLVDYLSSRMEFGRVLAIDAPFWVYLLPHYTGKRLIDGWYPQGSILVALKKVGKYYTLNNCKDDALLKHFIDCAEDYGIKWVIVGVNGRTYLLQNSAFKPVLEAGNVILYENVNPVSYVEAEPPAEVEYTWSKDLISLTVKTEAPITRITVKEAYFPAWKAYDNGVEIPLSKSELGFMVFTLKGEGLHQVNLVFEDYNKQLPKKLEATLKSKIESLSFEVYRGLLEKG